MESRKTTVNYFDLGLHEGNEVALFLDETKDLDVDIKVYAVEANPIYYDKCVERFKRYPNVEILNYAISNSTKKDKLYLDDCGEGSSLYKDKVNVTDKFVTVKPKKFSEIFNDCRKADINIVRANIEGSEYDLIKDLEKEKLFPKIDVLCGVGGWLSDMRKVVSLQKKVSSIEIILKRNRVRFYNYIAESKNYNINTSQNVDMGVVIQNLIKKPKVLVTVLNQGQIRPEMLEVVEQLKNDDRYDVHVLFTNLKPSETNRNISVKTALDGNYDYLLTIDHDIIPRRNPLDLIALGKDVIGCACPQWNMSDPNYPLYFVGMDKVKYGYTEHKDKNGLQEVDAVGSGCLLMSRKVLQDVSEPFLRKWKDGIAVRGLDFYFCEKAKEKGYKVYCHYDYKCSHMKEVDLLDVFNFKEYGR